VPRRRVAGFRPGDVEADHAAVPVGHGQLGDLARAGGVPHGREQLPGRDRPALPAHGLLALGEALADRLDHLVEAQPPDEVLLRSVPHLRVHDAVGGEVLDALAGHPPDRVGRLHHGDGVVERGEVRHQVARAGRVEEPPAEAVGIGRRQRVPDVGGQVDDGRRAEAAVEVVVQEHLRGLADHTGREHGLSPARTR
jgi:hypothetical protein